MKKIISLFQRNYDGDHLVREEIVVGAEWVLRGEGIATRKFDGTCCLVRDGKLFKRYELKRGKIPPEGFEPAGEVDSITGNSPGWLPVSERPDDRYHREAFSVDLPNGTYELCGPKVQGNPEGILYHTLVPHGIETLPECPRSFDEIRAYLISHNIEGIVWHHLDGRMVKIKGRDFGIKRVISN